MRVQHVTDSERGVALLHTVDDAPVSLTWLADVLARDDHALFGAYDDADAPIGYLYGYELRRFKRDETEALLYEIDVLPSAQRLGAGRALVNAYLSHCRSRGIASVWVPTNASNKAAMGLYAATGGVASDRDGVLFSYDLSASE